MKELTRRSLFGAFGALIAALGLAKRSEAAADGSFEVVRSDAQWRAILQPQEYEVLRRHGTEPPYSGLLDHEKRPGTYACAGCALALFDSKTKFDSGTGWPSFYALWRSVGPKAAITRTTCWPTRRSAGRGWTLCRCLAT